MISRLMRVDTNRLDPRVFKGLGSRKQPFQARIEDMVMSQVHHLIACILNRSNHLLRGIENRIARKPIIRINGPFKIPQDQIPLLQPFLSIVIILRKIIASIFLGGTNINQVMVELVSICHDPSCMRQLIRMDFFLLFNDFRHF